MSQNILPHFLIFGAPKCGTSALNYYLSQHPDLHLYPKEIHFFGKDLGYKVQRPTFKEYQSHFKEGKLNGEASVWYLYSDSIYQELINLKINPKIIVLLRNPIEVSYALHSQNIVDANENITNFEEALKLEKSRKEGRNLPPKVDHPGAVLYKKTGVFFPRIRKLKDNIPRDDIFIGLQTDLKINTKKFMENIEKFLGITKYENYDFKLINKNKVIKSQKLHRLLKKPGKLETTIFRSFIPIKFVRKFIMEKVYKLNLKYSKRKNISNKTEQELKQYFKQSNDLLAKIIDLDISDWNN